MIKSLEILILILLLLLFVDSLSRAKLLCCFSGLLGIFILVSLSLRAIFPGLRVLTKVFLLTLKYGGRREVSIPERTLKPLPLSSKIYF